LHAFRLVFYQLARVNLEGICQLANRGHMRLGVILLDAVNRVLADAGEFGQVLLAQRTLLPQSSQSLPDIDHGLRQRRLFHTSGQSS
jgi:hypothetical protein